MVVIGVDTHKSTLAASAVDELGREVAALTVANESAGHQAFEAWLLRLGPERRVGIEGGGSFGAGLARRLVGRGETVVEVPARLTARERRRLTTPGKSDPGDALAIARIALREAGLGPVSRAGQAEDLRLLSVERDALLVERTRLGCRLHAHLMVIQPGYERQIPNLRSGRSLARAASLLAGQEGVRVELAGRLVVRIREIDREARILEREIGSRLASPRLQQIQGVGPIVVAMLVGQTGDVLAVRSAAAFAALSGTAPIPASSGQTNRHRLNRGGNRQLNRALHVIALTQSRSASVGRTYLAGKRDEGKTWSEAMRCLKRQLAGVVFRAMVADARAASIAGEHELTT
jgi:transposase